MKRKYDGDKQAVNVPGIGTFEKGKYIEVTPEQAKELDKTKKFKAPSTPRETKKTKPKKVN